MKKIVMMMAAAAFSAQAMTAQTVQESKTFDNIYVGVHGGVSAKTTHTSIFNNLNWTTGLRVGRNFTPVFGLAADVDAYLDNATDMNTGTTFRGLNLNLLGTVNLSNWFAGYKGFPRLFEVSAIAGLGWAHIFDNDDVRPIALENNGLNTKLGLDLAFNLGADKAWQVYVEPAINYNLDGIYDGASKGSTNFNVNNSHLSLQAGLIYKFGNSNGTHNFKVAQLRDQAEIDGLNNKINELRNENANKDNTIANDNRTINDLRNQLAAAKNKKPVTTVVNNNTLQPTVIFQQGKSSIDKAQMASVAMVAKYLKNHKNAKLLIKGYASPEGSKEINQKLSEARAEAVKNALVKNYKIAASRLSTKGMGATDELFDEVDFNRVATFTDTTK